MADINQNYKARHTYKKGDNIKFYQGRYNPVNTSKCLTEVNIYRSSWEFQFMRWCDNNPMILKWASEPIGIAYLNPVGNLEYCMKQHLDPNNPANWKRCTYYTDFWIEIADETKPEGVKRIFIEIKPFAQTQCPKPINEAASLKDHKRYNREAETYLVNQAKWQAAAKYFSERGAEFMVITEKTLEAFGLNLSTKGMG